MESTAHHLLRDGDLRSVIGLIEEWSQFGTPTAEARLAEADAFLRLKLMDKAWTRLKGLIERREAGIRPHRLAARVFLERGWPAKARKVVQAGLDIDPDDERLMELWEEASAGDPPSFDTSPADDPYADLDTLVVVAEHFMAQGAFVRAKSLLERVRRSDALHGRARDLLWALEGDFSLDASIHDLVERYAPDLGAMADLAEESDSTESADLDSLPLQIDREPSSDHFSSLFRHLEPADTAAADDGEVTAVSSLAEMQQLAEAGRAALDEERGDDTQIMRVVHKAGGYEPVTDTASVHQGDTQVDSAFNLADFRREMGMDVDAGIASDFDYALPEGEDDNVVVVTRREDEEQITETTTAGLTLDTSADERAAEVQGAYQEETWANLAEPEEEPEPLREPTDPVIPQKKLQKLAAKAPPPVGTPVSAEPRHEREASRGLRAQFPWQWWLAALVLMALFGGLAFVFLGGLVLVL